MFIKYTLGVHKARGNVVREHVDELRRCVPGTGRRP